MDVRGLGLSEEELRALGYRVGPDAEKEFEEALEAKASRTGGQARRMWFWSLIVLSAMVWVSSVHRQLPAPVPANRSDTVFSSARAMSQLVEIARRPHPIGSPEHERVRSYLTERLGSLGLDPQVQTVTRVTRDSKTAEAVTIRNIVARVPGSSSTGALALTAHYDAIPLSPGAGDAGVGVAAILETVRAVLAGDPLRNDLVVVLTDGADLNLAGTRAFTEHHPWMESIAFAISVEMEGVSGPAITVEAGAENGALIRTLAGANPRPTASSLLRELAGTEAFGTDLIPFREAGVPGFSLTALGGRVFHHQPSDRAEVVSEETLEHHGLQLLALARHFGSGDFAAGPSPVGPDQGYASFPFIGLIHHSTDWAPLTSLLLLGAWVLMGVFLRFRGGSYAGIGVGALFGAGLAGAAAGLGWCLLQAGQRLHPEYGLLESAFYRDGAHVLGLAGLVVAMGTCGYGLVRRRFGAGELMVGALVLPLAVAAWVGTKFPFAGLAIQWPSALALLSVGLMAGLGKKPRYGWWEWTAVTVLAAGMFSILVPNLELMAAVTTFRGGPLLGASMAVGLLLILPSLEFLRRPQWWWAPALAALGATGLLVSSLPAVSGPERHPEFSSLAYLVDDSLDVSAFEIDSVLSDSLLSDSLFSDSIFSEPNSSTVRRVGGRWLTVPGPGEEWARSWAAEEALTSTAPGVLFLPQESSWEIAGTGPETYLAKPRVHCTGGTHQDGYQHLQVAIQSEIGAEMVGIRLMGDEGEFTSIGGERWSQGGGIPVREVVHWGTPEAGFIRVGLRVDEGTGPVRIQVVEHHLRPGEVLGEDLFVRDASLVPNPHTGSDRIIQRSRVVIRTAAPDPSGARG
jgi:hypothetical protein